MDRVFPLLTELGMDPYKRAAFLADPDGFVAAAGLPALSAEERGVLRGAGQGLGGQAEAGGAFRRAMFLVDPGPDPLPDPDPPAPQLS